MLISVVRINAWHVFRVVCDDCLGAGTRFSPQKKKTTSTQSENTANETRVPVKVQHGRLGTNPTKRLWQQHRQTPCGDQLHDFLYGTVLVSISGFGLFEKSGCSVFVCIFSVELIVSMTCAIAAPTRESHQHWIRLVNVARAHFSLWNLSAWVTRAFRVCHVVHRAFAQDTTDILDCFGKQLTVRMVCLVRVCVSILLAKKNKCNLKIKQQGTIRQHTTCAYTPKTHVVNE